MTPRSSEDVYAETLAVFDRVGSRYEPLTTPEVADALDAHRRTVYKRLDTLVDRGALETKETGANSRVWWRPDARSSASGAPRAKFEDERDRSEDAMRGLFDDAPDGIVVHDVDGRILDVNETFVDMVGYDREWLLSKEITDVEIGFEKRRILEELRSIDPGSMRKLEFEGTHRRKDGSTYPAEVWVSRIETDAGTRDRFVALVRDISERVDQERELREKRRQLQGVLDSVQASVFMKNADGQYLLMNQHCREMIGVDDDENVIGMTDEDVFPPEVAARVRADDARALEAEETVEVEEALPTTEGTRTKLTRKTPIFDEDGNPYAVCAVATDITDRKERQRELKRQRAQLEALNHLNDVVQGITEAVIDQSTREEIERVVCDRLVDSDSYQLAWVCGVNSEMQFERRAMAGVDEDSDEAPRLCDPNIGTERGTFAASGRRREIQVGQTVLEETDIEPCHAAAREFGYRSSAIIPIVHEGTVYGLVGIASERTDAFAEAERDVVARLGEIVGHAIAGVERKRALLSDDVVELEFRMHDVEELGMPNTGSDRVVFDRILPLGDGTYLEYGRATGDAMASVRTLVDEDLTPHSGPLKIIETGEDETRFELRMVDPPFLPAIVDSGGYIDEARIEDGTYFILVHLPPSADVHRTVDAVTDAFPGTEMVSRRQTTRAEATPQQLTQALAERLTDRQRAALEAGYFAGFFEWPRDSSGKEVAESLDIGASTFHQHIRKAEKKLLDVILSDA